MILKDHVTAGVAQWWVFNSIQKKHLTLNNKIYRICTRKTIHCGINLLFFN